jgi:hypothetical protein
MKALKIFMKNILTTACLLMITLMPMIIAAGYDMPSKKHNSDLTNEKVNVDTGYCFDARYFLTPLSRFY